MSQVGREARDILAPISNDSVASSTGRGIVQLRSALLGTPEIQCPVLGPFHS